MRSDLRTPTKDLSGRVALITGATGGLGGAIARALAAERVDLVLSGRRASELERLQAELERSAVRVATVVADLADETQAVDLVRRAEQALGPIDILVNNAGVEFVGRFADRTQTNLTQQVNVNLLSPMLLTHAVVPGMIERGRGNVVSISSAAGKYAVPWEPGYSATKFATGAFMRSLAMEFGPSPVAFSTVTPGIIRDAGIGAAWADNLPRGLGRLATRSPDQVGAAVVSAIRHDRVEVVVSAPPITLLAALNAVAPGLAVRVMHATSGYALNSFEHQSP